MAELVDAIPARVLGVYAHPDDPEISCGGTLARWARGGAEVHILICTRGEKGSPDPKQDPAATRFDEIGFMDVISRDLRVMDLTAITLCRDNSVPILVFDVMTGGNIMRALRGEPIGTLIQ